MGDINQAKEVLTSYIRLFNNIEDEIAFIEDIVSNEIEFLDPFHHTFDIAEFKNMLLKTAKAVENPRFEVTHTVWDQQLCFLRWNFSGKNRFLGVLEFSGMSEIHFGENNKVLRHIDHWDSARYFYRRLPVIRWVFNLFAKPPLNAVFK